MKKLVLVCFGFLCSVLASGQTNFQKLTLDEACAKAKVENKLVFVDLYTSWCAPCKLMANEVFPDVELGKFMNEYFVCVKYDAGTEQDGAELAKKFNVQAYPTFLMLNVDKELENQIVGATLKPLDFMAQVEAAMKASLANLERKYVRGDRDVLFLTGYLKALVMASMYSKAQEVCTVLFEVLPDKDKSNRNYWFIFEDQSLAPVGSLFMDFLISHFKQFSRSLGEEKVLNRLSEAFEIKLRDMIRGRERMDDLDKVVKQMAPHHFNSRERLDVYVALAKALRTARKDTCEKNVEKLLGLCEKEFPRMEGKDLVYFYFPVTIYIANVGTKEQYERVYKLHEYVHEYTNYDPLRIGLGNMMNGGK